MSWRNSRRAETRETTVSTSGDVPELPSVDLRRANNRLQPNNDPVEEKSFKIKLKGSVMIQTMIFTLADRDNILSNIFGPGLRVGSLAIL